MDKVSEARSRKEKLSRLRYIEKCARKFIDKAFDSREMPNIFDKTSRSFIELKDSLLLADSSKKSKEQL